MAVSSPYSSAEARQSLRNITDVSIQSPQSNTFLFSQSANNTSSPITSTALTRAYQRANFNRDASSPSSSPTTINFSTPLIEREAIEARQKDAEDYARAATIDAILARQLSDVKDEIRSIKKKRYWNIWQWQDRSHKAVSLAKSIFDKAKEIPKPYIPGEGKNYDYYIIGSEREYTVLENDAKNADARLRAHMEAISAIPPSEYNQEEEEAFGGVPSSSSPNNAGRGFAEDGTRRTLISEFDESGKPSSSSGIGVNESFADVVGKNYSSSPSHSSSLPGYGKVGGSKPFRRQSKREDEDARRRRMQREADDAEIERGVAESQRLSDLKKIEDAQRLADLKNKEQKEMEERDRQRLSAERRRSAERRASEELKRELDEREERRLSAERKLQQISRPNIVEVLEDVDLNNEEPVAIPNSEDESINQIAMEIVANTDIPNVVEVPGAPAHEKSTQPGGVNLSGKGVLGLIDTSTSMLDRVRNWWAGDPEANAKWWAKWKKRAIIGGLAATAGYAAYAYANSGPIVHLHKFEQLPALPQAQTALFDPIRNFVAPTNVIPTPTLTPPIVTIPNPIPIEISVPTINLIPDPFGPVGGGPGVGNAIPEVNFWDWLHGSADPNITGITRVEIPFVNVLGAVAGGLSFAGIVRRLYHKVGNRRQNQQRRTTSSNK